MLRPTKIEWLAGNMSVCPPELKSFDCVDFCVPYFLYKLPRLGSFNRQFIHIMWNILSFFSHVRKSKELLLIHLNEYFVCDVISLFTRAEEEFISCMAQFF